MKLVTVWRAWSAKTSAWEFNHLEDGHATTEVPEGVTKEQSQMWARGKWQKVFAYLDDENKVVIAWEAKE